jgi:hypothetical protein
MTKTRIRILTAASILILLTLTTPVAQGQSDPPKFEVGGQVSFMNFETFGTFSEPRQKQLGGGGRFTYNFNKYVAAETQIDFFPQKDTEQIGPFVVDLWGSKTLVVGGVKAGNRGDKFGVFAKARPGIIHFSGVPGFLCITAPCPQPAKTNFAFDVGGVLEFYPSARSVVRFDFGDTIIKHQRFFGTSHQLQASVGVGVRF